MSATPRPARPLAASLIPLALAASAAHAGPVVDIPPAALPSPAWFAANPDSTVNIHAGGSAFADNDGSPFDFNNAVVTIEAGGELGFFTIDSFIDHADIRVAGGKLTRTKVVGLVSPVSVLISSGSAERGLWLQGDTQGEMTDGFIGLTASGQAPLIVEDSADFTMSGGSIDDFVIVTEDATFTMTGGTIEGGIQISLGASVTVAGGSTESDGFMHDADSTLIVTGGTIGPAFVVEKGTVHMSGGAFDTNAAILNTSGVDPVFNMTGGALGATFRAYDGTINISGGIVGSRFRCGRPTGDGSGVTCNLVVKSATLDGTPITLSATPAVIAARGGETLTCVMADDSVNSFILNESSSTEDYFRAGAVLTIAAYCPADLTGEGDLNFFDISAYVALFTAMDPDADLAAPFGSFDFFDIAAYIASFTAGCP